MSRASETGNAERDMWGRGCRPGHSARGAQGGGGEGGWAAGAGREGPPVCRVQGRQEEL